MVAINEKITKEKHDQVIDISTITKRLENYKDLPFIEQLPFAVDFILDNKFRVYIQKIYLYGSYAYGEPNKYSDIDLCVIIDDSITERRREVYFNIEKTLWNKKLIPNDLLVYNISTFKQFMNLRGIENVIFKYGELIYVRP